MSEHLNQVYGLKETLEYLMTGSTTFPLEYHEKVWPLFGNKTDRYQWELSALRKV